MRKEVTLITGAGGEMGQALIERLADAGRDNIVALDLQGVPEPARSRCLTVVTGDILDEKLLARLESEYAIPVVYHLAALLSSRGEAQPELAQRVNVEGTLGFLKLAVAQSAALGRPITFLFPSSVAAYGMPDLETKRRAGAVKEHEWNVPATMYGCNKLYCEHLGRYYSRHFRRFEPGAGRAVDFRAIRFPGLISAFTVPSGGTSDYAPEMIHHAAQGKPYGCFVREDTRMSFMAMPDAIKALTMLETAPRERLTSTVYNVTSFSPSAGEILALVRKAFPDCQVTFAPDPKRQSIVDSWPADQDDSLARQDWGWQPDYGQARAFEEYLVPNIKSYYAQKGAGRKSTAAIELTLDEALTLREMIEEQVSDLGTEIADTDARGFRERLKRKKVLLTGILGRLPSAS